MISPLKNLIELIASVRTRAGTDRYRRKLLVNSKIDFPKETDWMLSGELNSAALSYASDHEYLDKEKRDELCSKQALWAWSGNDVTRPTPNEIDGAYSRDVDGLVLQLLSPQGEEVLSALGRLSARLSAARPDPATYVQAQPLKETRAFVVTGDPSPGRDRIYSPTSEERDHLFSSNVRGEEAAGSAGDDQFELPAGCVLVLPRGEEAYLRGRGWRITRDRRLMAWDWQCEPGRPLPVGGVMEAAANRWKHDDGTVNLSAVPLNGAQYYRGNRWCNRDGSGTLYDKTDYEWEDRRFRMRSTFWDELRGAVLHRPDADISSIGALALHPAKWAFFFWALIGPYMTPDDWRMPPGQWRWPKGASPARDTPVQQMLRYTVGPESWRSEWTDVVNHDRKWAGDFFPSGLLKHPAMRDALRYPQQLQMPPDSFTEAWLQQMKVAVQEMDTPTDTDRAGVRTAHRQAFENLKNDALGGKTLTEWWKDVEDKVTIDTQHRAEWRAKVEQHRSYMREHCSIAYVPDPEGAGPYDGPSAGIVVQRWSHDFMPEPLVLPSAFEVDVSAEVGHDFRKDVDQGNGEPGNPATFLQTATTIKRSLSKVERQIRENEARRSLEPVNLPSRKRWLGTVGPDDLASAMLAEAKVHARHDVQLVRRTKTIYGEVERLLELRRS